MRMYSTISSKAELALMPHELPLHVVRIEHPGGSFDPSTFAKNRSRLLAHEVTGRFLGAAVNEARRQRLLSEEHFSVDGTLLEAWASLKSVRPRDEEGDSPAGAGGRNPWKDFWGERHSNATHVSTTDPEALLARKGGRRTAKLSSPATCSRRAMDRW